SKLIILFSGILYTWIFLNITRYDDARGAGTFTEDMLVYYSYLPATFIDHDLTFKFKDDPKNTNISWTLETTEGRRVLKFTMGVAVLQTPFFLLAHASTLLFDPSHANGFTLLYHILVGFSGIFYTLLGLIYIRKILKLYVDEYTCGLTLGGIALGTNLFYYATNETIMSHPYSFCFVAILIYHTIKWYENWQIKNGLALAFCIGLLVLIRPTNLLMVMIPALYGITNWKSVVNRFHDLKHHATQVISMVVLAFLIYSPQLIYWKYCTGHWIYYSYQTEKFYFDHPHIIETLFGFRKGLFIYTPIMFLALIGVFYIKKQAPAFRMLIPIYSVISIYIISCWWCWWYGGSLGLRAYIDSFPLWSLPLAFFIQQLVTLGTKQKKLITAFIVFFILYQSLEIYQYRGSILHYDSMTFESWKASQFQINEPDNYEQLLQKPQPGDTHYPEVLEKK
ncbi:MAG: hypothetical protein HYZ42_02045, partial [Bacteroidetes bacterium]|nr:hypothetical protein [Bacteroidota bacterium]